MPEPFMPETLRCARCGELSGGYMLCKPCWAAQHGYRLDDVSDRIERTERERYEDRCAEREAHSQRALADYDRMLMRGPY